MSIIAINFVFTDTLIQQRCLSVSRQAGSGTPRKRIKQAIVCYAVFGYTEGIPSSSRVSAMRSCCLLLLIFLCAATSFAAAGEKSVFWMSYAADPATVALYHLDAAAPDAEVEGGEANEAVNAVPTGQPATLDGGAAFSAQSRVRLMASASGRSLRLPRVRLPCITSGT